MIAVKEKISQNNVILENPEKQTVSWRAFKLDLHKMSLHLECPSKFSTYPENWLNLR